MVIKIKTTKKNHTVLLKLLLSMRVFGRVNLQFIL